MSDSIEEEVVGKSDKVTVRLIHDTDIKQTQVRPGELRQDRKYQLYVLSPNCPG